MMSKQSLYESIAFIFETVTTMEKKKTCANRKLDYTAGLIAFIVTLIVRLGSQMTALMLPLQSSGAVRESIVVSVDVKQQ